LGKQFSKWTLIRLLQLHLFTWRRVAKSLESQRDEGMFQFFKQELALLRQEQQLDKGNCKIKSTVLSLNQKRETKEIRSFVHNQY
jgi:hypothetical protein